MNEEEPYRHVAFGDQRVEVFATGSNSKSIVDTLFLDAPAGDKEVICCQFTVHDKDADRFSLVWDGTTRYGAGSQDANSIGQCALTLWSELQYQICNSCDSGLILHAAAVTVDDQLIIFPGASGAGKTTLSASLLAAGANYLTDELVFINTETGLAQCLTRPFNVKHSGQEIVMKLLASANYEEYVLHNPVGSFIPHRLINDTMFRYPGPPQKPIAIIFPRFSVKSSLITEALSPANASVQLMSCLVNARNLDGDGLQSCRKLAESTSAWRISYGPKRGLLSAIRSTIPTNEVFLR